MNIGFVFECGPDGGDMKVLKHLTSLIAPDSTFDYEALSVKTTLLKESGKAAKRLLQDGCEKVFIVWDLYPAWREDKGKPCRHEDKEAIKASLTGEGLSEDDIIFLCLEEELEAWLLADGRALTEYFSKPHRKVKIGNETKPDRLKDPKGKLMSFFKQHKSGVKYEGTIHAEQIIKGLVDFRK
ncbi:MAG: hypothetical protein IPP31_08705 [Chitinophagaceae bacterium]|nr:hypothetical protein [Chitinophagaceae bacterium]